MRRFALALSLAFASLAPSIAFADPCVTCGSGSTNGCQQCRLGSGGDTFANRKECEKKGCKISGTSSCSTASNVKVCKVETSSAPTAQRETLVCPVN